MENEKITCLEKELAEFFIETFSTPTVALSFFMDTYHNICYYHTDAGLAKDVAFAFDVISKEMVFKTLAGKSAKQLVGMLQKGAETVFEYLNPDILNKAAKYSLDAATACIIEFNYDTDVAAGMIRKTNFLFRAAQLSALYNVYYELENENLKAISNENN
ncbi:hypothetical protein [Agriterribacter sp.]|uniref:hypothetical protein n=1 Tax=Agriterribacter sp. TaxID=2821509 RepID=UPI002B6976A2|nr:hypothetical protein [Agriterribacter sp.]HTN08859.1 hypothetical protein [Agriterribacter sp.]